MIALLVQADPTRQPPCYADETFEMQQPVRVEAPPVDTAPPAVSTITPVAEAVTPAATADPCSQTFNEDTGDLPSIVPTNAPLEDVFAPPPKAPEPRSALRKYLID